MRDDLKDRVRRLGLYGVLHDWERVAGAPWLEELVTIEERERAHRSLIRRTRSARLGSFRPMADFDYAWPEELDRAAMDELFTLAFVREGSNVVIVGPNGLGKTMIAQNLANEAVRQGMRTRFTTAADMLSDLAAQEGPTALARRERLYANPELLVIDEVGYLNYDNRYADLLFSVVNRRYRESRSIVLTTNMPFAQWPDHFANAACVVTLVDRLTHRAEILQLAGRSYRHKEAEELHAARRARRRKTPD
ncbi:Chromosomal replication initiator protein DnaA [compost metagenome]